MEHEEQLSGTSDVNQKKRVKVCPIAVVQQPFRNRLVETHPKNFQRVGMHQGWGH